MKDDIYISLDLETTGLDKEHDRIIEVGIVKFQGNKIISEFSTLVNPEIKISPIVSAITGIDEKELEKAPLFDEISNELASFVGDFPIIGHNIDFDLDFLKARGMNLRNHRYDTWYLSTMLLPALTSHSLISLSSFLEIEHLEAHRALSDAKASMHLFNFLVSKISKLADDVFFEAETYLKKSDWQLADLFLKNKPSEKVKEGQLNLPILEVEEILQGEKKVIYHKLEFKEDKKTADLILENFSKGKKLLIETSSDALSYIRPVISKIDKSKRLVLASYNLGKILEEIEESKVKLDFAFLEAENQYFCPHKFEAFKKRKNLSQDEERFIVKILLWLPSTIQGRKEELALISQEHNFWEQISADSGCLNENNCFFKKALEHANKSPFLIIDQQFLIKDLIFDRKIIPDFDYLIFDEASQLEDTISSALSSFTDDATFDSLVDLINIPKVKEQTEELKKIFLIFWGVLGIFTKKYATDKGPANIKLVFDKNTKYLPEFKKLENTAEGLVKELDVFIFGLEKNKSLALIKGLLPKIKILRENIYEAILNPNSGKVYWSEIKGEEPRIILRSSPFDIKNFTKRIFKTKNIALISNVLTVSKSFDYFEKRMGIRDFAKVVVRQDKSPEVLFLLPDNMIDSKLPSYKKDLFDVLRKIIAANKKSLILFPSAQLLNDAFQELADLAEDGIDVFVQGSLKGLKQATESFKASKKAVIFVSGFAFERFSKNIECDTFVLVKLPFEPPYHPIYQSRVDNLTDGFSEYTIGRTIIKFRRIFEAFRKGIKKGVFIVLDHRITYKDYGIEFVDSIEDVDIKYCKKEDLPNLIPSILSG